MTEPVIQTEQLTKSFKELTALDHCTLEVQQGQVVGLLGPNGAGKSTLLRLLMGFYRPTSGFARVFGLDAYQERVRVHQKISYLPGDARLFRTMRGRDAIQFFCDIRGDMDRGQAEVVAERLELNTRRWIAFMSTGMRQKLALTIVLSSTAPILILDEPTANLDPSVRNQVLRFVAQARADGRTVLFSSHVLSEIEEVCDRVVILRSGKLVHQQSLLDLKRQHRIRAKLAGDLPTIPDALRQELEIKQLGDDRIQIETPGELSLVMGWLARAPLDDVYVEPVSLKAVYDRYHPDSTTEVAS